MITSKKIEALVQRAKEQVREACGIEVSVYVTEEDLNCWDATFEFDDVSHTACLGMFENEIEDFINNELADYIISTHKQQKEQEERDLQMMMIGANKFQFHAWNYELVSYDYVDFGGEKKHTYVPRFIVEAEWNCNIQHMIGKWKSSLKSEDPDTYIPRFYAELSKDNRKAFLKWVMNNYDDEQKI